MFLRISWRIIITVISAIAIAYSLFEYLDSLQQKTTVIVADQNIPAHTVIEAGMLREIEVELNAANALVKLPAKDMESVTGAITLEGIKAGDPISMDKKKIIFDEQRKLYLKANGKVDLTSFIPKDKRLMTIALEPDEAVDNIISLGDLVDVIVTSESKGLTGSRSSMILKGVEVFKVEAVKAKDNSQGKQGIIQHVTLILSPQDAVVLALAKEQSSINLILNPWSGEQEDVSPVSESNLFQ